jgi:transitional endoplasmic reticulum ATPase
VRLTIEPDRVELEATHRVVFAAAGEGAGSLVTVRNGPHRCVAVAAGGDAGSGVAMDKYLRIHLHARVGEEVEISPAAPGEAGRLWLAVPAELERAGFTGLIRDSLVGKPVSVGQRVPLFVTSLTGDQLLGEVRRAEPAADSVVVTHRTEVELTAGRVGSDGGVTYDRIGGLRREIDKIREVVEDPLRRPEVYRRLGIAPPRGVLLHGPPGTGKTLITRALAHEIGASVHAVQGPEIISHWYGGAEHNLREVFEAARADAPAIVLIDEIDSIAPRRDSTRGEVEHRVVATLLTLMDGLAELKDVVVVGTTNRVDAIDPALRRPGRFEYEIHIGVPDTAGRAEILSVHTRRMPLAGDVSTAALAGRTHGFTGADLASLCRQAAHQALRRANREAGPDGTDASRLTVRQRDFERALAGTRPSAMREVLVEIPRDVSWDAVGGAEDIKRLLTENVVYSITRRATFLAVGIRPAGGILLHGPPGTGKTLLAKVVARESGANFIGIRGPELRSKWFGESEERVRSIFAKAREVAPCVVFLDEVDAIAPARGRDFSGSTDTIVNQLLAELDGVDGNDSVVVIGATNRVEVLDPALLRPGRFEYQVHVPLPDLAAREAIFRVHLAGKPVAPDVSATDLAALAGGLSGADIAEVCRLATMDALRRGGFDPGHVTVTPADLRRAVSSRRAAADAVRRPPDLRRDPW